MKAHRGKLQARLGRQSGVIRAKSNAHSPRTIRTLAEDRQVAASRPRSGFGASSGRGKHVEVVYCRECRVWRLSGMSEEERKCGANVKASAGKRKGMSSAALGHDFKRTTVSL